MKKLAHLAASVLDVVIVAGLGAGCAWAAWFIATSMTAARP